MKSYLLGFLTPVLIVGFGLFIWRFEQWKKEMSQTFGGKFLALAQEHDQIADEWEWKLYGDGHSGWAGWDCGRQGDGLYRDMALTLIERYRGTAKAIRAELPGQPEYDERKYEFDGKAARQRRWQEWYDDFHKRNNLPAGDKATK